MICWLRIPPSLPQRLRSFHSPSRSPLKHHFLASNASQCFKCSKSRRIKLEVIIITADLAFVVDKKEILSVIVGKLTIIDKISFGCVCKNWHDAAKSTKHKASSPWFMFKGINDSTIHFYSMENNKVVFSTQGVCSTKSRCIGSSHGWLITSDDIFNMHLFCPITAHKIPLPPIDTLPNIRPESGIHGQRYSWRLSGNNNNLWIPIDNFLMPALNRLFIKAELSSAPTLPDKSDKKNWEFTVMMIYCDQRVAFTRARWKRWKMIEGVSAVDLISCDGKLHAVNHPLGLLALDINGDSCEPRAVVPGLFAEGTQEFSNFCHENPEFMSYGTFFECWKLVNSFDGKLLVVMRQQSSDKKEFKYKVVAWEEREHKWKHLTSLGDHIIFIGKNHSVCLQAAVFPELKRNSIYYNQIVSDSNGYQNGDIGVFCLEEDKITPLEHIGHLEERYQRRSDWGWASAYFVHS